jgi:hypothetical protein
MNYLRGVRIAARNWEYTFDARPGKFNSTASTESYKAQSFDRAAGCHAQSPRNRKPYAALLLKTTTEPRGLRGLLAQDADLHRFGKYTIRTR